MKRLYTSSRTMPLQLNLIAACDSKMGIGKNNELPWRLKNEMAYFNRMTTSGDYPNFVVMGRKTWDSIPPKFRPLKDRINVVLSRNEPPKEIKADTVMWSTSWDELVGKLETMKEDPKTGRVWVVGGSYLYKLALESPHIHRIYLTKIQKDYECDVFFPNFDLDAFQLVKDPEVPEGDQEESDVKYNFFVYEKVQ